MWCHPSERHLATTHRQKPYYGLFRCGTSLPDRLLPHHLDGKRPSAVFARGYYTRTNLVSYNWDGKRLSKVWKVDSGWTPMSNPFNDSPHGVDGTDPPVREDHDPGVPFPECGRRGRRRKARDCLRLRHDQRGRVGPVQPFDTLPSAPLTE